MDYKKAYKDALERARKCLDEKRDTCFVRPDVIFPELQESEDERIKKEIYNALRYLETELSWDALGRVDILDAYAWLEKQGEQKPVDKVEPKFHEGDWIANSIETVQITGYDIDYGYQVDYKGHLQHRDTDIIEKEYHPWTIQDAKDGDVLVAQECYVIFKEIDGLNIKCYCTYHYMGFNPSFRINTLQNKTAFHPATKEQRDLLFQKMKEAGYEWDADKKELKKIEKQGEQKPVDKVGPKFKVGDWITDGYVGGQITSIEDNYPCYKIADFMGGINTSIPFTLQDNYHLWTIQDAKDGDVLAYVTDEDCLWIMIYWSLYEPYEGHVHYHALLVNDKFSDKGTCCICIDNLKPATKEQRDLLFQKMKEAGYEWDGEKKELRKIEKQCEQRPNRVGTKVPTGTLKEMLDNIDPIALEETRKEMLEIDGFDAELNALLKKYEYLPKEQLLECMNFYVDELEKQWRDEI